MATKTPQEGDALYNADGSDYNSKDKKQVAVTTNGGAPEGWPRRGTIEFDNVWMKYLPSAPYALKGECCCCCSICAVQRCSFSCKPGQHGAL
jgi:hypothetical protein